MSVRGVPIYELVRAEARDALLACRVARMLNRHGRERPLGSLVENQVRAVQARRALRVLRRSASLWARPVGVRRIDLPRRAAVERAKGGGT